MSEDTGTAGDRRTRIGTIIFLALLGLILAGAGANAWHRNHQEQQRIDRMTEVMFCEQQQITSYEDCIR